jgi:hypothetical protein
VVGRAIAVDDQPDDHPGKGFTRQVKALRKKVLAEIT